MVIYTYIWLLLAPGQCSAEPLADRGGPWSVATCAGAPAPALVPAPLAPDAAPRNVAALLARVAAPAP